MPGMASTPLPRDSKGLAPRRRMPWPLAALLAAAVAIGGGYALDAWRGSRAGAPLDLATIQPGFGARSFGEAVAQAEITLASAREGVASRPGEWLREEVLARALIARWRLRNDYADLTEADALLDAGIARSPDPAGPVLSRAMLSVLIHRLPQADAALARFARSVAPDPGELSDAASLTGDVALQRGELATAQAQFARSERFAESLTGSTRSAVLQAQEGNRAEGIRRLEGLLARPRQQPSVLAELMLQRANLAYMSGDWGGAGRWIGAAQRVFRGYWLADVYAAQQFALAGRTDEAIKAYMFVANRTARPEVQDALAHLLRLEGRGGESRAWAAKAAAGWESRARRFPEAVIHHQAEHELAVGSAARALAFAQTDAAARPQAPNLVLLARALLSAGKPREALAALDRSDAQGWVSAGQAMARAETLAALGDTAGSEAARAKAEAINPRAADPRTRLIWFGHD